MTIVGLLEGAHAGRGLGHELLRHCQRARILIHIIDGTSPDPLGDYEAIQTELQLFAEELVSKPQARTARFSFSRCHGGMIFTVRAVHRLQTAKRLCFRQQRGSVQ